MRLRAVNARSCGRRFPLLRRFVAGAAWLLITAVSQAEVTSTGAIGFSTRHVVEAPNVQPPVVWAALTDISRWWDSEHTYSGDSRNLTLDPVVRGCFCEKLSLYAGIEHAVVVYALPAKILRLRGALGPLQEFAVTGSLTFQIEAAAGGSKLTVTYSVSGFADRPMADWAPIVDEVLDSQVQRLGRLVTTGSPELPKTDTPKGNQRP
jgi:hypothetical protein